MACIFLSKAASGEVTSNRFRQYIYIALGKMATAKISFSLNDHRRRMTIFAFVVDSDYLLILLALLIYRTP